MSELRFSDLLFQPGEWRQQLVRWLLTQIDARLAQSVESHAHLAQPRLAHMAAGLGLCSLDRTDIFSGSARRLDQLAFFEKLLRLAEFNAGLQEPIRSAETVANEVEASVELLTWPLTAEPLLRHLSSGPESLLSPELGLLLRGKVEKRKAEGQAVDWSMAAWREELEAEAEDGKAKEVGEFSTEQCAKRQEEALKRLATSSERFLRAEERTFRGALQEVEADPEAEGREEYLKEVEDLEGKLAALSSLRSGVERVESAVGKLEIGTERQGRSEALATEVLLAIS